MRTGSRQLRPAAQEAARFLSQKRLLPVVCDLDRIPAIAKAMREQFEVPLLGVATAQWDQHLDAVDRAADCDVNVVLCAPLAVEQIMEALKRDRLAGVLSPGCNHEVIRHGIKSPRGILTIPGAEGPASLDEAVSEMIEAMGVDAPDKLGDRRWIAIHGPYFTPERDPPPSPRLAPTDLGGYLRLGMDLLRRKTYEAVWGSERILPEPPPRYAPSLGTQDLLHKFGDALRFVLQNVERSQDVEAYLWSYDDLVLAPNVRSVDDIARHAWLLAKDDHRRGKGASVWMSSLNRYEQERRAAVERA